MKSCFFLCTFFMIQSALASPKISCMEATATRKPRYFTIQETPDGLLWQPKVPWSYGTPEITNENQVFKLKFTESITIEIKEVNGVWVGVLIEPAPPSSPAAYQSVLFRCVVPEHGASSSNGG